LNSRKAELEAGQVRAVAERRNKEKELQETRLQLLDAQKRYEGISSELLEVKSTISAHRENRARTENDRKMEQAVEDMKRLFPGVRGRLVDLVSPAQKSVKTAVSVALGKHMDSVVVNSEAVVHECIAWLRENKVRPFTFLPLDSLRPEALDESVEAAIRTYKSRTTASAFRLAKDCLRYDPEIEPAVQYACGSTVIADTLTDAKELRFKRDLRAKVVSLDGTMIAKNGNMTGGISASDRDLDRQSKWDEKELRNAQSRRDELLAEEELLKRKVSKARTAAAESFVVLLEDMETSLNTHNTKLNVMVKELENTSKLIADASAELAAVDKQLKESRPERDAAMIRMEGRSAQQAEIQAQMDSISENAFREFATRLGLADMRDYETQVRMPRQQGSHVFFPTGQRKVQVVARHEAEIKAKKQITELLSKLRSKLDYERDRLVKNSPEAAGVRSIRWSMSPSTVFIVELCSESSNGNKAGSWN
jgi:structural maintenance of chromosome 1